MKKVKVGILVATVIWLAGCNSCNSKNGRPKPDVSNINVEIRLQRFDKDLFATADKGYDKQAEILRAQYSNFFDFFVSQFVVGPRPAGDTSHIEADALKNFTHDAYMLRLQDSIGKYFSNTKDVEEDLSKSLRYFKYYFPHAVVPKVVAINSGFSIGAFTYEKDVLGIGLDLYLGADNPDYDSAGIYSYLHYKMRREYIARNSMEVLYNFYFGKGDDDERKPLIEAMVDKGKKMYFLSLMLPDAPDSLIAGFTNKQTKWCENSEYEIWQFLNDKDLLYRNDNMNYKRYLDEAPTTQGMPPESPGNIGSWIGWQMVKKFMQETGNKVSLNDLLLKYDSKTILEKAKYRPAKAII
jgi:hypothetical protein